MRGTPTAGAPAAPERWSGAVLLLLPATVLLRLEQGPAAEDVVLDLSTPAVRRVVQGLCGAD